jgi:hypothetical protein
VHETGAAAGGALQLQNIARKVSSKKSIQCTVKKTRRGSRSGEIRGEEDEKRI